MITQKLLPRFDQGLGEGCHLLVCALLTDSINGHPNSGRLWKDIPISDSGLGFCMYPCWTLGQGSQCT